MCFHLFACGLLLVVIRCPCPSVFPLLCHIFMIVVCESSSDAHLVCENCDFPLMFELNWNSFILFILPYLLDVSRSCCTFPRVCSFYFTWLFAYRHSRPLLRKFSCKLRILCGGSTQWCWVWTENDVSHSQNIFLCTLHLILNDLYERKQIGK